MDWALPLPIRGPAKAILMCLAYHHNGKTGRCDPSVPTIALETGCHRETVFSGLKKLISIGAITAKRRAYNSNAFVLHFDWKPSTILSGKPDKAVLSILSGKADNADRPTPSEKPDKANRALLSGKPLSRCPEKPTVTGREPSTHENQISTGSPVGVIAGGRPREAGDGSSSVRPIAARAREHSVENANNSVQAGSQPADKPAARQAVRRRLTPPKQQQPRDPVSDVVTWVAKATGRHVGELWGTAIQWHEELLAAGFTDAEAQQAIAEDGAAARDSGKLVGDPLIMITARLRTRMQLRRQVAP